MVQTIRRGFWLLKNRRNAALVLDIGKEPFEMRLPPRSFNVEIKNEQLVNSIKDAPRIITPGILQILIDNGETRGEIAIVARPEAFKRRLLAGLYQRAAGLGGSRYPIPNDLRHKPGVVKQIRAEVRVLAPAHLGAATWNDNFKICHCDDSVS